MDFIKEIKGNLFDSQDSLCHCVSQDLRMSKGIAREFSSRFRRHKELQNCRAKVGEIAVIKIGSIFVYNLVTKFRFFNKPSYRTLKMSLISMRKHALTNNVHVISMPKIGCGLDGLKWQIVKCIISNVFINSGIRINVYYQP